MSLYLDVLRQRLPSLKRLRMNCEIQANIVLVKFRRAQLAQPACINCSHSACLQEFLPACLLAGEAALLAIRQQLQLSCELCNSRRIRSARSTQANSLEYQCHCSANNMATMQLSLPSCQVGPLLRQKLPLLSSDQKFLAA